MFRVGVVFVLGACGDQRNAEWQADCEKIFTNYISIRDEYLDFARHDRKMAIHVVDTLVERENTAKADSYLDTEWPQMFQELSDALVADRETFCRQ